MRKTRLLAAALAAVSIADAQNPARSAPKEKSSGVERTAPVAEESVILRAMKDELERARGLKLETLDKPYYIEYGIDDHESYSVSSSLGALMNPDHVRMRIPRIRIRVGSPEFDNGNYLLSDYYSGARYDPEQLPVDDDYGVLRRSLWLASDRAYKGAVEAIARKRAALRNVTQQEALPDFWKAEPVVKVLPGAEALPPAGEWPERVRRLSRIFSSYPEVNASGVSFDVSRTAYYFRNSEGTTLRLPDQLARVTVHASAQAKDGMRVRDSVTLVHHDQSHLPAEQEIAEATRQVAENVKALAAAPAGESYSGPVLFDGIAGAQLMGEVLGPNLALPRRPVGEASRPAPFLPSELEGRVGSRVLPDTFDVIDNPLETTWNGRPLLGSYPVDDEGVVPKPLTVVEKGKLQSFLLTRQPVKGYQESNGRARLPGPYGARQAMISNLFIRSSETVKAPELKARLLKMIADRNKPYGIIVRKMDYPTTASNEELRSIAIAASQRGAVRPVSPPALVYKVYPDGREELVRGLRFRSLNVRTLRDIVAASEESYAFHYMNTPAPFAMNAGGYVAPASVVAPALLIDDLELDRPQEELPQLPVVPAPPLSSSGKEPAVAHAASR